MWVSTKCTVAYRGPGLIIQKGDAGLLLADRTILQKSQQLTALGESLRSK